MNSVSLNFTLRTDRGRAIPKTRRNSKAKIKGKSRIVIGGVNCSTTIKIPRTINSKISIIDAVIPELMPGIDLGK